MNTLEQVRFKSQLFDAPCPKDGEEEPVDDKVTFDARQQAKLESLIKEVQVRGNKELKAKLAEADTKLQEMQAQIDEAKKSTGKGTPADKKKAAEDVAAVQSELAELKVAFETLRGESARKDEIVKTKDQEVKRAQGLVLDTQKQVAMQAAAANVGFIDVNDTIRLTEDAIYYDPDLKTFLVKGDSGGPKLNSSAEPMSLAEYFVEVAAKKPHHVRSDAQGGVGAGGRQGLGTSSRVKIEDIFGKNSNSKKANELSLRDPKEYRRLREVARESGLI